jgi:hypothetical protein
VTTTTVAGEWFSSVYTLNLDVRLNSSTSPRVAFPATCPLP